MESPTSFCCAPSKHLIAQQASFCSRSSTPTFVRKPNGALSTSQTLIRASVEMLSYPNFEPTRAMSFHTFPLAFTPCSQLRVTTHLESAFLFRRLLLAQRSMPS